MNNIRFVSIFFLFIVFLLVLSACNSNTTDASDEKDIINFTGESKHWNATLKIIQNSDTEIKDLELRFKGDDMSSVGKFNYTIDAGGLSGFQETNATLDKDGELQNKGIECENCAILLKDSEVVLTIEWNDKTESISLTSS